MNGYISLFRGRPLKVYAANDVLARRALAHHMNRKNLRHVTLQPIRPLVKG